MNSIQQELEKGRKINEILTRSEHLMFMEALVLELIPPVGEGSADLLGTFALVSRCLRELPWSTSRSRHNADTDPEWAFIELCDAGILVRPDGSRPYMQPNERACRTKRGDEFLGQVPCRVSETLDIVLMRCPSTLELMARAAK